MDEGKKGFRGGVDVTLSGERIRLADRGEVMPVEALSFGIGKKRGEERLGFGGFALLSAGTGTRLGLPAYWAWMAFVWTIGTVIGTMALAGVFFLVVTPLGLVARLSGRDRLGLARPPAGRSLWQPLPAVAHDPERQF